MGRFSLLIVALHYVTLLEYHRSDFKARVFLERAIVALMTARKSLLAIWLSVAWLAGLGLVAYGLWTHPLPASTLWSIPDLHRLIRFAAGWVIIAAAFYFFGRRYFPHAAVLVHAVWMWAIHGPAPLVAQLWMGAAAVAIGLRICGSQRQPLITGTIAWTAGMAVIQTVMGFTAHLRENSVALWLIALAIPIYVWRRHLLAWARSWYVPQSVSASRHFGRALLGFILSVVYAQVLGPEVGSDALTVHMMVPATVARLGEWPFDVGQFTWAMIPLGVDWAYTVAWLLGGEHSLRLLNFLFLVAILSLLYHVARRWVSPGLAILAVAAFASNPLVPLETGHAFVENGQAAYLIGAAWCIDSIRRRRWSAGLPAAGLMLGAALSSKLGSLPYVALLAAAAAMIAWIGRPRIAGRWVAYGVLTIVLCGSFPYIFSYRETGNPIFPFENQFFRSPHYPYEKFVNQAFVQKLGPAALYDMTFDSQKYLEGTTGSAGLAALLFSPLLVAALVVGRPFASAASTILALGAGILIFLSQPYLRYIYPSMALLAVPLAAAMMLAKRLGGQGLLRGIAGSVLLCVMAQVYLRPSSTWHHLRFPLYRSRADVDLFEREHAQHRLAARYLNIRAPGEPAAFFDTVAPADFAGRVYNYSWQTTPFALALGKCETGEQVQALLRSHRIGYVVSPIPPTKWTTPAMKAFLQQYAGQPLVVINGIGVYDASLLEVPAIELLPSGWDSWKHEGALLSVEGATVRGANRLHRDVAITLPAQYRFGVEAQCPADLSMLKLRIDWRDRSGSTTGSDERLFPCARKWQTREIIARSPRDAVGAQLTAGPGAKGEIRLKHASFRNLP
jgi:hypothetical protein